MRHQRPNYPSAARGDPPNHRARRITAVLVAAAVLIALAPATASAESTADNEATTHPVVASYASDYSVTLAEAQRRLERIPHLQQLVEALHEIEADRLAGWGIDHSGTMTAWVWLKGDQAPLPQAAALAAAHGDLQIRTGASYTFAQLVAAQDRFRLGKAIGPIGNTGTADADRDPFSDVITHTGIDLNANALEIGIHIDSVPTPQFDSPGTGGVGQLGPVGNTGAGSSNGAVIDYVEALLAAHIEVPFYAVESERVNDEVAFEGGRTMSNGGSCTSGFTVRQNGSGRYGVTTAGHCDRTSFVTQGISVAREAHVWTPYNDAALYLIPSGDGHTVTNKFVCNEAHGAQVMCRVNSVGPSRLMMMGHHVCHYGISSGQSCGTIDDVRHQPGGGCDSNDSPCKAVFVRMTGPGVKGCDGDSGGPVYGVSAAYGIHKGSTSGDNCNLSGVSAFFSGIRLVQVALRAQVVTNWTADVL